MAEAEEDLGSLLMDIADGNLFKKNFRRMGDGNGP